MPYIMHPQLLPPPLSVGTAPCMSMLFPLVLHSCRMSCTRSCCHPLDPIGTALCMSMLFQPVLHPCHMSCTCSCCHPLLPHRQGSLYAHALSCGTTVAPCVMHHSVDTLGRSISTFSGIPSLLHQHCSLYVHALPCGTEWNQAAFHAPQISCGVCFEPRSVVKIAHCG